MKSAKSRPLKILISRNSAWAIGGAELSAVDQAVVLNSIGHKVFFLSNQKSLRARLPVAIKKYNWLSIESPKYLRHLRLLYLLPMGFVQALYYTYKLKPDIINPHSREDQIAFTLTKFIHKKPLVWKNAGDLRYQVLPDRQKGLSVITQKMLVAAARRADHIYSLNQEDNNYLLKQIEYLSSSKLSAIPSSILFSNYETVKKPANNKKLIIGTIIRLHKDKGVQDLIKAFKTLDGNGVELWIIGEGEYMPKLKSQATSYPRIKFYGQQDSISAYLASIDIFVQPAHKEPWGRNIKEAMFFGKAIVGANNGGIAAQIENGKTGLLFETGNAKDLANKLKRIIRDPKLLNKLSISAKAEAIRQGDFEKIVKQQILPLYQRITNKTKLVVDATPIVRKRLDGIGRYSQNIITELSGDYRIELLGFIDDHMPKKYGRVYKLKRIPIPRRIYSWLFKRNLVPEMGGKSDKMLYLNFIAFPKTRSRSIVVIHDLAFLTHPETLAPKNRHYLEKFVPSSLKQADEIIAVSNTTKNKLVSAYNINPAKISIVPPGIDLNHFKPANNSEIEMLKKKYGLTNNFILFLGTLEPRKNIDGCLEAYKLLPSALRKQHSLVLAGSLGWQNNKTLQRIEELKSEGYDIRTIGYVEDTDAPFLYSAASVFVFPSLEEGFGIPVIEAMACGTPVVASNIKVLKEISGNAALFADPDKASEIASQIQTVLTNKKTAQQLVDKGFLQSQKFSWQQSAKSLIEVIDRIN